MSFDLFLASLEEQWRESVSVSYYYCFVINRGSNQIKRKGGGRTDFLSEDYTQ